MKLLGDEVTLHIAKDMQIGREKELEDRWLSCEVAQAEVKNRAMKKQRQ